MVGSGGLYRLWRLRTERSVLGADAFRLLSKNDELRQRILRLRSDRGLERLARQELGLVRDGEVVYRFRSHADGTSDAATSGN